ncbi:MAG: PRC-barrel domain-containing protein [Desulforhopalus sp.]
MTSHNVQFLSASSINGDKVKNPQGESLGKIEDLMINLESGRVTYAVLSFGGFLGLGEKYFAIPMEALTLDPEDKVFILNVPKEKLDAKNGFDKDNWPNMADREWATGIYSHYEYKPYWD